jgi:hypothetical protein
MWNAVEISLGMLKQLKPYNMQMKKNKPGVKHEEFRVCPGVNQLLKESNG